MTKKVPKSLRKINFWTSDNIVNGEWAFKFIDTIGFPFDMLVEELRETGFGFDVPEFIRAAHISKNYKPDRLKAMLLQNLSMRLPDKERVEVERLIDEYIEKTYNNQG